MLRHALLAVPFLLGTIAASRADNWPAWRGGTGQGSCTETGLPTKWSPTHNVKWKVPLPDEGNSTPIVWNDKVFLTQATDNGRNRSLLCFARKDGSKLWERTVPFPEAEATHKTNPHCAGSPATDGECVVVAYGSAGVHCYDLAGKTLWSRDLGPCKHIWGYSMSPVLYKNLVLVSFGPHEKTFLLAMNKADGKDVWKVDAEGRKPSDFFGSWSTPVVADVKGRPEVVMSWPGAVKGYNPETGEHLWTCRGLEKDGAKGGLTYTSPLVTSDAVIAMAGYGGPAIGFKTGGKGDVTGSHRLWRNTKNPQRIGSGVIIGDYVYAVNEPGLTCLELATGKTVWSEAVPAGIWSSLVLSEGKLYVTARDGETWIVAAKPEFELLARNPLNKERTMASLAVSDGELFIRTYKNLWCISEKK